MGKQTFIEINGKKYDTVTGKQLASSVATTHNSAMKQGSVDGFSRRTSPQRATAKHTAKQQQKSQTLVRKSVRKPETTVTKKEKQNHISKSSLGQQSRRVASAKETVKNPRVKRYGVSTERTSIAKKHDSLPVKQETSQVHTPKSVAHTPTHTTKRTPENTRRIATERMIESALDNAHAHEEVYHSTLKKKNNRRSLAKRLGVSSQTAAISSATLAAVLLAGFFAVQNVPNFAMRVAATRAGFAAEMPDYKPAGFSFNGPIDYTSGRVTVSFTSNTDDRAYDVTQQSSKWNSDALLSNFVVAENKQYQTYEDKGRTLYIYDDSSATWVDNGIWYQIEGESKMTTDQLARIAASI